MSLVAGLILACGTTFLSALGLTLQKRAHAVLQLRLMPALQWTRTLAPAARAARTSGIAARNSAASLSSLARLLASEPSLSRACA